MTIHTFFADTNWYRALTLSERIQRWQANGHATSNDTVDAELAQRRLQRWRSEPPFNNDGYFEQRLELDRLTEEQMLRLLGESAQSIHDRLSEPSPAWLSELEHIFAASETNAPLPAMTTPSPSELRSGGFLNIVLPLIQQGIVQLRQGVEQLTRQYTQLPFKPDNITDILFANLPQALLGILSRTMVLELNVARLQGVLSGDGAEERFTSFLERLRQPTVALTLFQEYPVLARIMLTRIEHWVNFSLEFLGHLCKDWGIICQTFYVAADAGVLTEIVGGLGDGHRGGRAVLVARFDSGFQIVYKPKSLAIDIHFQELLDWLNQRGQHAPFRTLTVLDRGTYGWSEYIHIESCTSTEQVRRFYERQGAYLSLLYALEATDFHMENLIATGEHPILIDLESLFHPRVGGIDTRQADQLASNIMGHSVLRVGLLPQRIWAGEASEGIDLSGLGGAPGQLTPQGVPTWENPGTDEMRLIRKRVEMPGSQNRPTLNGEEVNVLDYQQAIVEGFSAIYQLILKHRDEFLSIDGPLACFAQDEIRAIMRATRTYGILLHESFHPDVLRDALDRDRLFDRLWASIEHRPYLPKLIPSEIADLQRLDIPMFTTRPDSRDVWDSAGRHIADFFDEPGMDLVRHRIQQLSEEDLKRQVWFIEASLTSMTLGIGESRWRGYQPSLPKTYATRDQLLTVACAIGDRLEMLGVGDTQEMSWIGLTLIGERYWTLLPMGSELYSGLSGITLFFAYLGYMTQEERYTRLARAGLTTLRRQVDQLKPALKAIGAFSGWGGMIYALTHMGALWNEPELLIEAESFVELLTPLIEQDTSLDIIGGAAGCIGVLLSLHHVTSSPNALAAAVQCGDHLIARSQAMSTGISWLSDVAKTQPLTGFSHGAAGMAWALMELWGVTGETRFHSAALDAMTFERSLFSTAEGNWPDLRDPETLGRSSSSDEPIYMSTWCHGAPGIGLSRLHMLQYVDNAEIRSEIDVALKTTLTNGFGLNHSLCHGDLGNLEPLLQASLRLDDPSWREHVDSITSTILDSIREHGWLCGVPSGVETPGLMSGLAGIGYGLLRLADPQRVPSVLMLEAPHIAYDAQTKRDHI